jgi:hypothetical protein
VTLSIGRIGPQALDSLSAQAQNPKIATSHITRTRDTGTPSNHKITGMETTSYKGAFHSPRRRRGMPEF